MYIQNIYYVPNNGNIFILHILHVLLKMNAYRLNALTDMASKSLLR